MVSDHKGLNLPGVAISVPALSDKDEADLRWALRTGFDAIALSFVRSGRDIEDVHRIMDEEGRRLPVIAKVEKPQAVHNIEGIVRAFDGIMVARGDLGVEMPLEQVPIVQKRAVKPAKRNAKPVIGPVGEQVTAFQPYHCSSARYQRVTYSPTGPSSPPGCPTR